MPSANPVAKIMTTNSSFDREVFTEPMKPAVTIVEHKIRNLEKRKAKLDQYKSEQDQGKELNADQLAAVAKYSEVTQQLDFARDLVKQFAQVNEDTRRQVKKELKKELLERTAQETEKFRQIFLFQAILQELRDDKATNDAFQCGAEGAIPLSPEQQNDLEALYKLVSHQPINRKGNPCFYANVATAGEIAALLLEGKPKKVNWLSESTYKDVKDLLVAVSQCEYFLTVPNYEPDIVDVAPIPVPEESSESESVPSTVNELSNLDDFGPPAQVVPIQESTYSFLQESQIDIESPHMDPAVVAVSSFVPPPISQTSEVQRTAFANSVIPEESRDLGGSGDAYIIHQVNTITIDDEINEWTGGPAKQVSNTFSNNDTKVETYEDGDSSNRYGSNFRGGFRGGRGNNRARGGAANGFSRGGSRGSSRGFLNGRIGHYRSDFPEKDFDKDYRGGRSGGSRGGNGSGGFRRGNSTSNNTSPNGYNGHSNNSSRGTGGYRGSRPSPPNSGGRPQRSSNGIRPETECY